MIFDLILFSCTSLCVYVHILGITRLLAQSACNRLSDAWSDSTAMFRLYLAFLVFTSTALHQVNSDILLAFLECLTFNGTKVGQLQNYLSAIKAYYVKFSLPSHIFQDARLSMYIKSLQKTSKFSVALKHLVDPNLLTSLMHACERTYLSVVFKPIYFLGFFFFS